MNRPMVVVVLALLLIFPLAPRPASAGAPPVVRTEAANTAPSPGTGGLPGIHHVAPMASQSNAALTYDEQLGISFAQSFTSLLYNVTAVVQSDPASAMGPAYLLNGLTDAGYWYQVGISWGWPGASSGAGFSMNYEVFDASGNSIFPGVGGGGLYSFTGPVHSGDSVSLNLYFKSGQVVMLAEDRNTGASAEEVYGAEGATSFVGTTGPANGNGFFTGLMTEWYHPNPYYGDELQVTYSSSFALSSAWMWADEFGCSAAQCTARTDVFDGSKGPVAYSSPNQLIGYSADGAVEQSNAYEFVTGSPNLVSMTFLYSVLGGGSSFSSPSLSYRAGGALYTGLLYNGTNGFYMDAGTQWNLPSTLPGSGQEERWQDGDPTSGAAGNQEVLATYYHQYFVTPSYVVDGGGSGYTPPSYSCASLGIPVPGTVGTSVWADAGPSCAYESTLPGSNGSERWEASSASANVTSATIMTAVYYHQYGLLMGFNVIGGGAPSPPSLSSVRFGSDFSEPLTIAFRSYWVDSGYAWNVSNTIVGSSGERWFDNGTLSGLTSLGGAYVFEYQHQYFVSASASPTGGGAAAFGGWVDAGKTVYLGATASNGWEFERWSGKGAGAFNYTMAAAGDLYQFAVKGPANETAIFYPGLTIAPSGGGSVGYAYGNATGSASSSLTIYVPVGTTVTLAATPSSFLDSFDGWEGVSAGAGSTRQVQVSAPGVITASFGLDLAAMGGVSLVLLLALLGGALFVMRRGRARQVRLVSNGAVNHTEGRAWRGHPDTERPGKNWARPELDRGFSPCESDVITRLDHGPDRAVREPNITVYFFRPTDLFFSLRSGDLHFLHLSALRGFLAPHLRQTWR